MDGVWGLLLSKPMWINTPSLSLRVVNKKAGSRANRTQEGLEVRGRMGSGWCLHFKCQQDTFHLTCQALSCTCPGAGVWTWCFLCTQHSPPRRLHFHLHLLTRLLIIPQNTASSLTQSLTLLPLPYSSSGHITTWYRLMCPWLTDISSGRAGTLYISFSSL